MSILPLLPPPRMEPCCAFLSATNFSLSFQPPLRPRLPAASLVAQPGPPLPGESWRTLSSQLYVNQRVAVGCFRASLCFSMRCLLAVSVSSSGLLRQSPEPRTVPALTPP